MFLGSISSKPGSRKELYQLDYLIKGHGGIYKIETDCRESLCTALAHGNNLLQTVKRKKGYIKLTMANSDITEDFVMKLNIWINRTTTSNVLPKLIGWKDGWITLENSSCSSLPLISTIAYLANYFPNTSIDEAIYNSLYYPEDYFEDDVDACIFTAYYIWQVQRKFSPLAWFTGLNCNGPATFVPSRFLYHFKYHKEFYHIYKNIIDDLFNYSEFSKDMYTWYSLVRSQ